MCRQIITGMLCLLLALPAMAETVYVVDRVTASVYSGPGQQQPVLGSVSTGDALELLESNQGGVRIRAGNGLEGWVEKGLVTTSKPARMLMDAVRAEVERAKAELGSNREKLKAAEAALIAEKNRAIELEKALAELKQAATASAPQVVEPEVSSPVVDGGEGTPAVLGWGVMLWLMLCFAMLVGGFALGALWWRERTRLRLGGMHIKVNRI